jgi:hypothetical protein
MGLRAGLDMVLKKEIIGSKKKGLDHWLQNLIQTNGDTLNTKE